MIFKIDNEERARERFAALFTPRPQQVDAVAVVDAPTEVQRRVIKVAPAVKAEAKRPRKGWLYRELRTAAAR